MRTKFNKDGSVSIYGMPQALYNAIQTILISAENSLEPYEEDSFSCDGDILFVLDREEKEALDKVNWLI